MAWVRLGEIAHARSGDKGSGSNIGVIAFTATGFEFLRAHLRASDVADYFLKMSPGTVVRYELPNLGALNFVLPEILDGGGSLTLRVDAQGKALGQVLLEMMIDVPDDILKESRDV